LDQTLSQTGVCINGTCQVWASFLRGVQFAPIFPVRDALWLSQCAPGFGCPHCDVRLDVAGTAWVALSVSDGFLDMCTLQRGGASCGSSFDCGLGGVCVNSKCVCQDGWNCNLCSQKIKQDTLAGTVVFPLVSGACSTFALGMARRPVRQVCDGRWYVREQLGLQPRLVCVWSLCVQPKLRLFPVHAARRCLDCGCVLPLFPFLCPLPLIAARPHRYCTMFLHECDVQWPR
jgi:hypothetical protein